MGREKFPLNIYGGYSFCHVWKWIAAPGVNNINQRIAYGEWEISETEENNNICYAIWELATIHCCNIDVAKMELIIDVL